jgi:hypothetical protein
MAAKDCIGPQCAEQLKLFMTPQEIKGWITDSTDRSPGETLDQMWDRKVTESKKPQGSNSHGSGVYDAVSSGNNILPSVTLIPFRKNEYEEARNVIGDGHHRVAAMADFADKSGKQSFVPVEYFGDSGFDQPVPKIGKPQDPPSADHLFTSSGLG